MTRFDLTEIAGLIAQKKYFLLHAPRQTGKTSCLLALADYLKLKLRYGELEDTIADGLAQTWGYADGAGAEEAHLVIFDRTPGKPWAEKIWRRVEPHRGMEIAVWGC